MLEFICNHIQLVISIIITVAGSLFRFDKSFLIWKGAVYKTERLPNYKWYQYKKFALQLRVDTDFIGASTRVEIANVLIVIKASV